MKKIAKLTVFGLAAAALLTTSAIVYASVNSHTLVKNDTQIQSKYDVGAPDAQELLELVNDERSKAGVAELRPDSLLTRSAQWKADDMVRYDYFGHIKPGETNNNGLEYLNSIDTGKLCSWVSENISEVSGVSSVTTSRLVLQSWMGSEKHREALLDPKYSLTGFGISGSSGDYKIVEHFCQTK